VTFIPPPLLREIQIERNAQWGTRPTNAVAVLAAMAAERPAADLGLNTLRAWVLRVAATSLAALEAVDTMIADAAQEGDVDAERQPLERPRGGSS
jgi:hypothetical protein